MSRLPWLFCFILCMGCGASAGRLAAQPERPYELLDAIEKRRDRNALFEVRQDLQLGNFLSAVEGLGPLIEDHPTNVDLIYMRGEAYRLAGDYAAAALDFARGVRLAPDYKIEAFMDLGKIYQRNGDYAKAQEQYRQFLSRIGSGDPQYETVMGLIANAEAAAELATNPVPFDPQPLRGGINTDEHHEYFPSISVDGQRLLFTRNVFRRNEDFYESIRGEDGNWSAARPVKSLNSDYNEAAQTVSADGSLIVFTSCGKPNGFGGCDLYYSEKTNGRWSPVKNMGRNVNSTAWDSHPTLSADGKLLFFSSTRPGGLGASDLWGSARNENGVWSPAVNLGKTLNTKKKDEFPFFHPDGRTLFFTSNGHPGMGDMDIFQVQLDNNRWSAPRNLGYPINTPDEETNLTVSMDGKEAFFSKREGGAESKSSVDIYTFTLPEAVRPDPSTYLEATVIDARSRAPLVAEVRFRATSDDRPLKPFTTGNDGQFLIVLPSGKNYALTVDLPGYLPYSSQFSLEEGYAPDDPYRLRIELEPADQAELPEAPIVLRNVTFASGSAELLPFSFEELDRLGRLLQNNPDINIEIAGHTDDVGGEDTNLALSEARAEAVYNYLVEKSGIAPDRLSYVGYGENKPVADNGSETGRSLNRRTEFRVVGKEQK